MPPWSPRAWAVNCEENQYQNLFNAIENNDIQQFRNELGLSSSDSESRDVFNKDLLSKARATTITAPKEEITLLHYACCLNPVRTEIITLIVSNLPSSLSLPSSTRNETPIHFATCCGNLPVVDLLARLSERFLQSKTTVLTQTAIGPNKFGSTIAHFAAAHDKPLILTYLRQACPELLSKPDLKGLTPLHIATRCYSERSLLLLCKWFSNSLSDENLHEELFKKDVHGTTCLVLLQRYWKSGSLLVLMDMANLMTTTTTTTTTIPENDTSMTQFWEATNIKHWHQRTSKYCPKVCHNYLWQRGRKSIMIFPFAVVLFAIGLSFFSVFYWPQSYVAISHGGSLRFLIWLCSSFVLIGSLVTLQKQNPGYIQTNESLHNSYVRSVMDRPEDNNTVEKSILLGIVASNSSAQTMFSSDLCPFCEIQCPRTKHGLPTEHCFVCGVCVEGLDHHCPWTGSCIGHRNIWTFRIFLVATMATVISYVRLFLSYRTPRCNFDGKHCTTWRLLLNGPFVHSIILLFFFVPLFLFAFAISISQLRLVLQGTTMVGRDRLENMKNVRDMKLCGGMGRK